MLQRLSVRYRVCCVGFFIVLTSGCMSAAVTSASLIYDNYNLQRTVKNQLLDLQAERDLAQLSKTTKHKSNIYAVTMDDIVLLLGQTPDPILRQRATTSTQKIRGVKHVLNHITIEKPLSTKQSMHDAWISTMLKTKLLSAKEVDASLFKVVTENHVVYLLGTVPKQQVKPAVYLAQHTPGVKKVVQVLRQTVVIDQQGKTA